MVSRKYPAVRDGEWVQPIRKGYKLLCCDCGLVHTLDFRIKKRRIQFRAYRDNRATGQIRRHSNISVKHTYEVKLNKKGKEAP